MKIDAGRSLIWTMIESGGLTLISFVVIFVVARILGPSELGTVALALSIVQMLVVVVDTLMHDAIVQRPRLEDDHLHSAFWICAGLSLSFAGFCWLAAPLFAHILETPAIEALLSVAAIGLVFSGLGSIPLAILRRRLLFKPIALRTLYARLSGAVVAVGMAVLGYGVWCLIGQYLVQTAVNVALVWPACPWRPKFRFSWRHGRELIRFGAFTVGSRIVWSCCARLFTVLVGYFLGVTAVGYLSIAQRIVDTLFDVMAGAAYNLALPIFSRYQRSRAGLAKVVSSASELAAISVPPMFIGFAACASPVVVLLLGEQWLPAIPLVQLLAVGAVLQFILLLGDTAIAASGRAGLLFVLTVISFCFVIGTFLLVKPTTLVETVLIWVGRIALTGPLTLFVMHRYLGMPPRTLLRATWRPLAVTLIMAAALVVLERYFLMNAPALLVLLILVPLGIVIYGAGMSIVCRAPLRRFARFIASGVGKSNASQAGAVGKTAAARNLYGSDTGLGSIESQ